MWCWRRLLRVPWTARRSTWSILKEISPEYSLEGLMLKLKLQYFGHLVCITDSFEKTLMLGKTERKRRWGWLPGASVRNSAHGKGHEEGGSAYAKAGSSLRSPPGNSRASTPKTRICLLYWFVLSPTPLTLRGAVPRHHLSLWKRVHLQLQLIKFLGVTRVFQLTNSFGSPLACLNRFFRPHVIVQSLPTMRGMRCSKLSKYRFLWAVKRLIRNCIGEGFFTCWSNVCC